MAEEKKPSPIVSDIDAELKRIELERAKLSLENEKLQLKERTANLQDIGERLAERELKREDKFQKAKTNGATLEQNKVIDAAAFKRCNHRKGGNGIVAVVHGKGTDPNYSIIQHQFFNGDWWITCTRCHKTWKPPVKADFVKDDKFDDAAYKAAEAEYKRAMEFPTDNTPSKSGTYLWSDGGEHYREVMRPTTLR